MIRTMKQPVRNTGLAAILTLVLAAAYAAGQQDAPAGDSLRTFSGVVTDSTCGPKHSTKLDQSAAGCTGVCVRKGASYALADRDQLYILKGKEEYLERYAGERVNITGTLEGSTIQVTSVDPLSAPGR